jgi:hypothetical protein
VASKRTSAGRSRRRDRPCSGFGCRGNLKPSDPRDTIYCGPCRSEFSLRALDLMRLFGMTIEQLLVHAAGKFTTAEGIADYLGVGLPTLYTWVQRRLNLTFKQFKRKYICSRSGQTCIVLDYGSSGYAWKYTLTDRLKRASDPCMCFVEERAGLLMTTLNAEQVSQALGADVLHDPRTGLHQLRYGIRLPLYRPRPRGPDDGSDPGTPPAGPPAGDLPGDPPTGAP